jgi:hypothetical protein
MLVGLLIISTNSPETWGSVSRVSRTGAVGSTVIRVSVMGSVSLTGDMNILSFTLLLSITTSCFIDFRLLVLLNVIVSESDGPIL